MKNKKIVWGVLSIVVILGILVGTFFFLRQDKKSGKEETKSYRLTFYDDSIPGGKYDIDLDKEENIKVTETRFCSIVDCQASVLETIQINLTGENKKFAVDFIKNFFKDTEKKEVEVSPSNLTELQMQTLTLLLENRDDLFSLVSEPYERFIAYDNGDMALYVYQNKGNLKVKRINYNEDYEITTIDSYDIAFSEKKQKVIEEYFEDIFKDKSENYYLIDSTMNNKKVEMIMNSLYYNDESYLEEVGKIDKLVFEIHNLNLKCPTVYLQVYNDNTYEFYHTFKTGKPIEIKKGMYQKDATSILKNVSSYTKDGEIVYSLKDSSGKQYIVSNSNQELADFLNDIPENLNVCANYED